MEATVARRIEVMAVSALESAKGKGAKAEAALPRQEIQVEPEGTEESEMDPMAMRGVLRIIQIELLTH